MTVVNNLRLYGHIYKISCWHRWMDKGGVEGWMCRNMEGKRKGRKKKKKQKKEGNKKGEKQDSNGISLSKSV